MTPIVHVGSKSLNTKCRPVGEWDLPVPGLPTTKPHRATDSKPQSRPGCGEDTIREKEHCIVSLNSSTQLDV